MKLKIICIEDDLTILEIIKSTLKDFNIVPATSLNQAEKELAKGGVSAVLLDLQLPDGDGMHFYSRLKSSPLLLNIPVIIMSGHKEISNKILAFSLGAEDFITKPFDPLELSARINSKISKSRHAIEERNIRSIGNIEIDMDRHKVYIQENGNEKDLMLTTIEQKILIFLSSRPEQVFSRNQILNNVWENSHITDRTVDSHIAHLRFKLRETKVVIYTVKNIGYKLSIKSNIYHNKEVQQ